MRNMGFWVIMEMEMEILKIQGVVGTKMMDRILGIFCDLLRVSMMKMVWVLDFCFGFYGYDTPV